MARLSLSIAIPVFNREVYFREALASALGQPEAEVIHIVDNASTLCRFEDIIAEFRDPRVRYHRNPENLGYIRNWNRCIELCQTERLLILHDDDRLESGYLRFFREHADANRGLHICSVKFIDAKGQVREKDPIGPIGAYADPKRWCLTNATPAGAIFSVDAARRLGGFNPRRKYTPDFDFWFQLVLLQGCQPLEYWGASYREYDSEERETTVLEKTGIPVICRRVQYKRNIFRFEKKTGKRPFFRPPVLENIPLRFVLRMSQAVGRNRWRYFYALYLRSAARTFFGHVVRRLLPFIPVNILFMLLRTVHKEGLPKAEGAGQAL